MSRYGGDPRYSTGNLPYRDPPPQRWDGERFAREREFRAPPVMDQRPPYEDLRAPPRRAPVYEERRVYEEDTYGPRGNRTEHRYFEEEDYYKDPRASGGAMIPFRPERPARPQAPPRPGILRRQSSLDTFDRRPARRYDDFDDVRAPVPPRIPVPVPRAPEGRYARRQDEPDYEDIRIQEPDRYGDDGFREYREREWVTRRRRNSSGSRSSVSRSRAGTEVVEDIREEIKEEKPYPRRGKTRMPKRLVHTKVLYDLGYPFYEEDERTLLIEKALGPDNIEQVFTMSKEYREREVGTTRLIEAPPAEPIIVVPPPMSVREPSRRGSVREEKFYEEVKTVPISEAPRSVRDWDALSVRSPSPKSHRSRSRRRSRRGSSPGTVRELVIEKEEVYRESSPSARSHRTATTRRRDSSGDRETIIEKTKIIRRDDDFDDSNSVHVGPLALVVDRNPRRSERDIKEEIRQLEREKRALQKERRQEREGTEIVKVERIRERSPSPRGEVIIERRGEEIVEVKKDRRVRSKSTAPPPGIIKAMMATLT